MTEMQNVKHNVVLFNENSLFWKEEEATWVTRKEENLVAGIHNC